MGGMRFFKISGFVTYINQEKKRPINPSIRNNFIYAIQRIKKLYPLYVLTFLMFVPFDLLGADKEPLVNVFIRIVLNLFLVQEFLPIRLNSYNTPSWFLCPLLLSYFIFPWLYLKIKNIRSSKRACINILLLYLIQIIIGIIAYFLPRPIYHKNMLVLYDIVYWFVYRFPLSRLLEIIIGYHLGYLFLKHRNFTIRRATVKEALVVFLSLIMMYVGGSARPQAFFKAEIPSVNYNRWWALVMIYTPLVLFFDMVVFTRARQNI